VAPAVTELAEAMRVQRPTQDELDGPDGGSDTRLDGGNQKPDILRSAATIAIHERVSAGDPYGVVID
jgi:hypothetical protein